jgi:hypothetical protein
MFQLKDNQSNKNTIFILLINIIIINIIKHLDSDNHKHASMRTKCWQCYSGL